uniref:von willebrand factor type A domain protein n=1 Tax=Pithovirus LCPAC302 TaxID=2506593 RepID=A0A481Z6U5_9VIRU|nr:MAG: von willebrand factor type A domain protein [Pithovirus LCPAC302]
MNFTAKSYSGQYGSTQNVGDIIHIQMSPGPGNTTLDNKEVIFLIDISGSMHKSMKSVKSSMLAFRDCILEKTPQELEELEPNERDQLIRDKIKMRVITFSNEAKQVWSNDHAERFEDVIVGLKSQSMTNMGDAIKLAFSLIDPNLYTWIVAMTDGESNKGPCRTAGSFQRLVTKKPLNAKIAALGYGQSFDPNVLDKVGDFVYVENPEMIPIVFGNLASEICSTVYFNCVVDIFKKQPTEFNDDTIIVPEGEITEEKGRIIVGNRVFESLCAGKTYDFIYLPHGNHVCQVILDQYRKIKIRYTDVTTRHSENREIYVDHDIGDIPENIRKLYYEAKKNRTVYRLYKFLKKMDRDLLQKEIGRVLDTMKYWTEEISEPYKEEILQLLENIKNGSRRDRERLASTALNTAVGTGYTEASDDNDTRLDISLSATHYYMESPLLNC